MHMRSLKKFFVLSVVYVVAMTSHENRSFSFQTFLYFFKIHHKIFNSSNFLLSEGGPSLAHSKNINSIDRECPHF